MTLHFDEVIPHLLQVGTSDPVLRQATQVAVVRDIHGRVRLAVDAPGTSEADRSNLQGTLEARLGGWFAGPIIFRDGEATQQRLANQVLDRAKSRWPSGWPRQAKDPIRGSATPIEVQKWGALQRVLSKETWLSEQEVTSPWPLHRDTPTIVSFYSYKGGLGRSTLVAFVAAILAKAGEHVIVVDLDVEAPGQQAIFDLAPERGVLDYLVEHLALGDAPLENLLLDATDRVPGAKGRLQVVPAGRPGWSFVEKIARLDFVGHTQEGPSPVHKALNALLGGIKKVHSPDWILLDARTGIHDLGGLAMHALAHIDVLLARDGQQGSEGLQLCLDALSRRRKTDDILTLVVHALAPSPLGDAVVSQPVQEAFREMVYNIFQQTAYSSMDDEDLPAIDDHGVAHTPYAIPLDPTLGRLEKLSDMTNEIDRDHYTQIVERLRDLAAPSGDSE